MGEAFDFLAAIRDEQFSPCGSDITAAILLEHPELVGVFAEPYEVAITLGEQALKFRVVRKFFNYERPVHSGIIIGVMDPVKQFAGIKVASPSRSRLRSGGIQMVAHSLQAIKRLTHIDQLASDGVAVAQCLGSRCEVE